jgi:3-deoxy-manno-octulosonate cytidylyltransferase (CMP-KDO synthetase)
MKVVVIIPSRYGSTRFPGKPLAIIDRKSMVQRVYEQAISVVPDVWVATDDIRIESEIKRIGGKCVLTSADHLSGTDRLAEAIQNINGENEFDIVVNVQGDEPFIIPEQITQVISLFSNKKTQIATLIKPITNFEDLFNPNKPKVTVSVDGKALYFSRSPIPYFRDEDKSVWHKKHQYYKHIGIYAYQTKVLLEITQLPLAKLEKAESLEQLRWLENNYTIMTAVTNHESPSVDTPEDLENILKER